MIVYAAIQSQCQMSLIIMPVLVVKDKLKAQLHCTYKIFTATI